MNFMFIFFALNSNFTKTAKEKKKASYQYARTENYRIISAQGSIVDYRDLNCVQIEIQGWLNSHNIRFC